MRLQNAAAILVGLLLASSFCATGLSVWYVFSARQNMQAQREIAVLNARGNALRSLMGESIEYSKRNPAMVPVLQSWNILPRASTNQPTAPAGSGRTR